MDPGQVTLFFHVIFNIKMPIFSKHEDNQLLSFVNKVRIVHLDASENTFVFPFPQIIPSQVINIGMTGVWSMIMLN